MPGFRPKGKAILKVPVDLMDTIRSSELSAVVTTEKIKGMFEPVEPVWPVWPVLPVWPVAPVCPV